MAGCGKKRISSNELAVVDNNLHPTCEQRITGIGAMMNTNAADGDPVSDLERSQERLNLLLSSLHGQKDDEIENANDQHEGQELDPGTGGAW